jgi:hypothetical protein
MKTLSENETFTVYQEFETVFIKNKSNNSTVTIDSFYGDPTCSFIDIKNSQIIIGGNQLIVWDIIKQKKTNLEKINYIHSIKKVDTNSIQVLTDPWSKDSSIWQLDLKSLEVKKVKDFNKYKNKPFSENITW